MDKSKYEELKLTDSIYWWSVGKRNIFCNLIKHFEKDNLCKKRILDIGCGMGLLIGKLLEMSDEVYACDPELEAVLFCKESNNKANIEKGGLPNSIPFGDATFDVIVASDVLEHVEDDGAAVKTIYNRLNSSGRVYISVPALQSMWSYNDVLNHHFRRYSYKELETLIKENGFEIELLSFYNSRLFPIAYTVRKIKNLLKVQTSDRKIIKKNTIVNSCLEKIFSSESKRFLKKKYKIGVSLICVAKKASLN